MSFEIFDTILPKLAFDNDKAGGALVVFKNGELAYQNAFGQANSRTAWTTRTLSVNFSIGKGVMATLIAVLVSKGLLDYDKPIAHYWADFAQNGKGDVTLLDVLCHRAGLYKLSDILDDELQALDFKAIQDKVAQMPIATPIAPNGAEYGSAYSAVVSGFILGGLVEKVTQMPLQNALDEFLATPLGVQGELYFGLPKDKMDGLAIPANLFDEWQTSDVPVRKKPTLKKDSQETLDFYHHLPITPLWQNRLNELGLPLTTANINRLYFDPALMNMANYKDALLFDGKTSINYYRKDLLSVPMPAVNGVSSARALASVYAMHAEGGVWQGVEIIDKTTLAKLRTMQTDRPDAVMPADMRWRAGFHRLFTVQNAPNAYGHMGYNGSVAFCDSDRELSLAFIHNFDTTMLNDVRQFVVSELVLWLNNYGKLTPKHRKS